MACDCASNLKEGIKKQDEGIRTIIQNAIKEGHSDPVGRAILFLIDIINRGKKKEKPSTKNKPVVPVTVREEKVELRNYFDPLKDSDADSFAKYEEDGKKEICFAYKFDKCPNKDGNGCPNRHPQKCEKFCEFGHKSIDPKGCETSECTLLHPKLCRNSTNRKECPL